jgi:N-acetylglutamate synthase-like GNAT family acetyltransferase
MVDTPKINLASNPSIDIQMLSALEFLHYCRRFQDTLFAFCFEHSSHCAAVLMDLRVLMAARIRQVVFCAADARLTETLESWNRAGDKFSVLEAKSADLRDSAFVARIRAEVASGNAPLVALQDFPETAGEREAVERAIVQCAVELGTKKIFFPGSEPGLYINGKCKSYPSVDQVREALEQLADLNLPPERVRFLIDQQEQHDVDIVLIEARRGAIYEEVFTHAGAGTLFTCEYPNILRPATEADVRDIMALMQPNISDGSFKPITEDALLSIIRHFMVYSVNDQIVAAASLVDYGDSCEVAKLCTLPRFQARGRARALVRALLEEAQKRGRRAVFALTVHPHVGEFFERLGFKPVAREELPEEWKAGYDFSRPSKGYRYSFEG